MTTFVIKEGDTSPALSATFTDADGDAVDLTGASVNFHMSPTTDRSTTKVDAAADVVDAAAGTVEYPWAVGDTDTVGVFVAEFEVTYADETVETFPNDDDIAVVVHDAIA